MSQIFKAIISLPLILSLNACSESGEDDTDTSGTPTANSGSDQTVGSSDTVTLTGSGIDSNGSISSYRWSQVNGADLTLSATDTASISFNAPVVSSQTIYTLRLTVTDNDGNTSYDDVVITVNAVSPNLSTISDLLDNGGFILNLGDELLEFTLSSGALVNNEYDFNDDSNSPVFEKDLSHAPWELSPTGVWTQFTSTETSVSDSYIVNNDGTITVTYEYNGEIYESYTIGVTSITSIAGNLMTSVLTDELWTDYSLLNGANVFSNGASMIEGTFVTNNNDYAVWVDANCSIACSSLNESSSLQDLFVATSFDLSQEDIQGTRMVTLTGGLSDGSGNAQFTDGAGQDLGTGIWTLVMVGDTQLLKIDATNTNVAMGELWDEESLVQILGVVEGVVRHIEYTPAGGSSTFTALNYTAIQDIRSVVTVQ